METLPRLMVVLSGACFLTTSACVSRHAIAPTSNAVLPPAVAKEHGPAHPPLGVIPLAIVPAGIGLKQLLIGGGVLLLGGVSLDLCLKSGVCVPESAPAKGDAAGNKPPPRKPPDERCKKVAEDCRAQCSSELPTPDFGFAFWNCVNACLTKSGCMPGMY